MGDQKADGAFLGGKVFCVFGGFFFYSPFLGPFAPANTPRPPRPAPRHTSPTSQKSGRPHRVKTTRDLHSC